MDIRRMTSLAFGVLAVGLTGLVAGCGAGVSDTTFTQPGGGATPTPSPTPTATPSISRFAGVWSGNYTLNTGQIGQAEITISNTGVISGEVFATAQLPNGDGPVSGTVNANGLTQIIFRSASNNAITFNGSGTLTVNPSTDRLEGTLNQLVNGNVAGSVTISLPRGPLIRA
ncbi:MAG: hypothetical protein V4671_08435 [Armatimonadota bacterium]